MWGEKARRFRSRPAHARPPMAGARARHWPRRARGEKTPRQKQWHSLARPVLETLERTHCTAPSLTRAATALRTPLPWPAISSFEGSREGPVSLARVSCTYTWRGKRCHRACVRIYACAELCQVYDRWRQARITRPSCASIVDATCGWLISSSSKLFVSSSSVNYFWFPTN